MTLTAGGSEDDLKVNVKSVEDPVFGKYAFSNTGRERTWKLETEDVDFDHEGEYEVKVVANDNGNMIEESFTLKVEGNIEEIRAEEERKKAEEEEAKKREEEGEDAEGNTDERVDDKDKDAETSKTEDKPEYGYVDADGNIYTQEEIDAMNNGDYSTGSANGENLDRYDYNLCYETYGDWVNDHCEWKSN